MPESKKITYEIISETSSVKPYLIKFLVKPISKYANIKLIINGVKSPPKKYKTNKKVKISNENIKDSSLLKSLLNRLFI